MVQTIPFKRCSRFVLVVFLGLLVPVASPAEETVPRDKLHARFMEKLNRGQIVRLLETLDRQEQLTDPELGAKYRWGRIPVDRTAPLELARWWENLTPRERRRERIEWFRNHSDLLDLDLSARLLGMSNELTALYRSLSRRHRQSDVELQPIHVASDLRLQTDPKNTGPSSLSSTRQSPRKSTDRSSGSSPEPSDSVDPEPDPTTTRNKSSSSPDQPADPASPDASAPTEKTTNPSDERFDGQLQSSKHGIEPVESPDDQNVDEAASNVPSGGHDGSSQKAVDEASLENTRSNTKSAGHGDSPPKLDLPPPELRFTPSEAPPLPDPQLREVR